MRNNVSQTRKKILIMGGDGVERRASGCVTGL